jgi:perosamine synthetase
MRQFWPSELGYKYKVSNVQAALGCAQLERIDSLIARRREVFNHYRHAFLAKLPEARMNPEPEGTFNSYWMPTLVLPERHRARRDAILETMQRSGIDSRTFFPPLSDTPVFKNFPLRSQTCRAHDLSQRAFNLPSYHDLSASDQEIVINSVLEGLRG